VSRRLVCVLSVFGLIAHADTPPRREDAVAAAVKKGVHWLRTEQKGNGEWGTNAGETALALMAMRHSGVAPTDRACKRAARFLERELPDGTVYGAALGTIALLAQGPEEHAKTVRKLVEHLIEGQCKNGQWTYAYRATAKKKRGDNSNTQIAVLALEAARARGIRVPLEPFRKCEQYFLASQNKDGGFGYSKKQRSRSYASMTAGGAMAMRICVAARKGVWVRDAEADGHAGVDRAFAWIRRNFKPEFNTGAAAAFGKGRASDSFWRHYWLWSLERACSVTRTKQIGARDWYAEGVDFLLEGQHEKGLWRGPERPIVATCFALLFFNRSTEGVVTPRDRDLRPVTEGD